MHIFYTKKADVERLNQEVSDDTEEYKKSLSQIPFHIQPLDDGYTTDLDGVYGKDFLGACPIYDIQEEDIVVIGSDRYKVVGVESYELIGHSHMELRLRYFGPMAGFSSEKITKTDSYLND